MKTAICKYCGKQIGLWRAPHWGTQILSKWMHNPDDGPDAQQHCGDDYGMEAEPVEQIV